MSGPARRGGAAKRKPRAKAAAPPAGDELAGPPPKRTRCTSKIASGKRRCKRMALDGLEVCSVHAGAPVGRPTKLSDEVTAKIEQVLQAGGYLATAAIVAGISRSTLTDWMDRGDPAGTEKANEPFREFREKVEQAQAEGEARNVALIARAGAKDWKAAAWLLERQFPDRWAGPRGRSLTSVHPDDFASGEPSSPGADNVDDDQLGPDGRPL